MSKEAVCLRFDIVITCSLGVVCDKTKQPLGSASIFTNCLQR